MTADHDTLVALLLGPNARDQHTADVKRLVSATCSGPPLTCLEQRHPPGSEDDAGGLHLPSWCDCLQENGDDCSCVGIYFRVSPTATLHKRILLVIHTTDESHCGCGPV